MLAPALNSRNFLSKSQKQAWLSGNRNAFQSKVRGFDSARELQFSFFSLPTLSVAKHKREKCSPPVTNILVVLGAVAQCLETVIASSNPGSCTEGLGHYGLGTAPFLPYFQYKPVRAAEWIHRGQFLFGSRLSSTPWPFG